MSPRSRRLQGEGSIYQRADGRWFGVVDFGHVGGKRIRKTVSAATKRELTPKFEALKAEAKAGVLTSDSTVEEWFTYWLDHVVGRTNRPSTMRNYRSKVRTWITPNLGHHRLSRLQPQHVRALLATMEDAGSARSAPHVYTILRAGLGQAVKDRVLPYNPALSVDPPRVQKADTVKFTLEEAKAILMGISQRPDRARWTVALLSGLRQGEALGLRWEDIDFEANTIRVERAAQRIVGQGIQMVQPKSYTSTRVRPMMTLTRLALETMQGPREGLVFPGPNGGPLDSTMDSDRWHAMLTDVGAVQRPLKAARATTASLLKDAGVHPKTIAEIMGHAQMSTTDQHYLAGDMERWREAMAAGDALLALT